MTLLNHELGDDEYESVIISGLAVMGFRDDRGWLNAKDLHQVFGIYQGSMDVGK
jgi:hypothetical protein